MSLICGCLTQKNIKDMLEAAKDTSADILEARLDFLEDTGDVDRLRSLDKPLITTCMPTWEGGHFKGKEEERIRLLESTSDFADYMTVELNTDRQLLDKLVSKAKTKDTKVIVAFHDFEQTPSAKELDETVEREFDKGADIAKIACMPETKADVLRLMNVLCSQEEDKTIMLSMGEKGRISRVISPLMGSLLTYGYISGTPAGPGQLSVDQLKTVKDMLW